MVELLFVTPKNSGRLRTPIPGTACIIVFEGCDRAGDFAETKPLLDFYAERGILVTVDAVQTTAAKGLSFGAPTELEIVLAEMLVARRGSPFVLCWSFAHQRRIVRGSSNSELREVRPIGVSWPRARTSCAACPPTSSAC